MVPMLAEQPTELPRSRTRDWPQQPSPLRTGRTPLCLAFVQVDSTGADLERQYGAVDADRVADLNGACKCRLRLHRLEVLPALRKNAQRADHADQLEKRKCQEAPGMTKRTCKRRETGT